MSDTLVSRPAARICSRPPPCFVSSTSLSLSFLHPHPPSLNHVRPYHLHSSSSSSYSHPRTRSSYGTNPTTAANVRLPSLQHLHPSRSVLSLLPPSSPLSPPSLLSSSLFLVVLEDLPDSAFDPTPSEVGAAYAAATGRVQANQVLRTSAMRAKEEGVKVKPSWPNVSASTLAGLWFENEEERPVGVGRGGRTEGRWRGKGARAELTSLTFRSFVVDQNPHQILRSYSNRTFLPFVYSSCIGLRVREGVAVGIVEGGRVHAL